MALISSYKVVGSKIVIDTPYCAAVVEQCRKWAGKFDKAAGGWLVPLSRLPDVQALLGEDLTDLVEVSVPKWHEAFVCENAGYRVGWYILATRRGRDSAADVFADLVAGEIPACGGSVKHPGVYGSDDCEFRFLVPRDFAVRWSLPVAAAPTEAFVVPSPVDTAPVIEVSIDVFFQLASPSSLVALVADSKFADDLTPAQSWLADKAWDDLVANVGKDEAGKLLAEQMGGVARV